MIRPFCPDPGTSQNVTTGAASATISLRPTSKCVRIVNYGATNPAFVRIGTDVTAATSADILVRPNSEIILYKGDGLDTLTYIQSTGATTLSIMTGEGGI